MTVGEIRKMKKFLTGWEDRREIVTYHIVETFEGFVDTYEVLNLSADLEDGVIYFSDIEDAILAKERSVIKGLLISSAELVDLYKDQFTIKLKDATIKVKVI